MNVVPFSLNDFAKRDTWTTADGQLCVRPGLRQVYAAPAGTVIIGAFSVRNDFADEVLHYVVAYDSTNFLVRFLILDENFATFQDFRISVTARPRVVTYVVVEGQILVCSPDFPTLWGQVGSGLIIANAVASINTTTTALDVPRGIACKFSNRAAIANGRSLFISDPVAPTGGDLRTFVVENQNGRQGVIYGMHEGVGGALVCVTSQGTQALPVDAAAVQIVGSNGTAWQDLSHLSAYHYRSSVAHRGRVWCLTPRGLALCDVEDGDEVYPSDPIMPRLYGARAHVDDYRRCFAVGTDTGPALFSPDLALVARTDIEREVLSWWGITVDLVGTLHDVDGTELLVTTAGAYRVCGDFDGTTALTSETAIPAGVLAGRVATPPAQASTVRHVDVAAQADGSNRVDTALRGQQSGGVPDVNTAGLVIGTSAWGDSRIWQPTPIAGMQGVFGDDDSTASRDVTVEVRVQGGGALVVDNGSISLSDSATVRPQNQGARS